MPAFEAEVGMPYWIDLVTSEPRKSAAFYEEVMGWEVAEVEGTNGYQMARIQGLPVAGIIPQPEDATMPDTWVTYFLSRDLDGDLARVEKLGGRVLAQPSAVHLGLMALAVDPAGGLFGLIEPQGPDQFIAGGEPGTPVWHELTATANFQQAADFYGELFDWELHRMGGTDAAAAGDNFEYITAETEGAPFAGFWNAQGAFPPQVPSFWQTYLGVRDIAAAADAASRMGGDIIREPWDSPFGRMCLIGDSTGAAVTLTEVEDAPEEDPRESDDILGL